MSDLIFASAIDSNKPKQLKIFPPLFKISIFRDTEYDSLIFPDFEEFIFFLTIIWPVATLS